MNDEELITFLEEVYRADPQRMEKLFAIAKLRYYEKSNASAQNTKLVTDVIAHTVNSDDHFATSAITNALLAHPFLLPLSSSEPNPSRRTISTSSDNMAALWTFEGHTLRQLRPGDASRKRNATQMAGTQGQENTPEVDEEGHLILFGSCGREKKYARCSVCYFRGTRCNTAHYCACCQRPVCIRPRTYPGEQNAKICWNVLHMDNEMVQRVEKRRVRKIAALISTPVNQSVATIRNEDSSQHPHELTSQDNTFQSTDPAHLII